MKNSESLKQIAERNRLATCLAIGGLSVATFVGGELRVVEALSHPDTASQPASGVAAEKTTGPAPSLVGTAHSLPSLKRVHEGLPLRAELLYVPAPTSSQKTVKSDERNIKGAGAPAPSRLPATPSFGSQHFIRMGSGAYDSLPEHKTRHAITAVMDSELARQVREVPYGSNRGQRVDFYIRQDLNHWKTRSMREWCAGFDSTVYMEANVPLSGGGLYGLHNPDYLLLRAGIAMNPKESPHIISVLDWFEANGYFYMNDGHQPKPGDAFFRSYIGDDGLRYWHTGLVRRVLDNGTLETYEGNTSNNALEKRYYPDFQNNASIYGFGSFFEEK